MKIGNTIKGRSRRRFLQIAGGIVALSSVVERISADATIEVNAGYAADSGREAILEKTIEIEREYAFDALTVEVTENDASELAARSDVRYVEKNGEMEALEQETPWGVERVGAREAHNDSETGEGAHIAIIDTGIDATHPDLEPNLGEGKAFVAGAEAPLWQDDNGHGTHCAGIAGAVDDRSGVVGVAPNVTLHAAKVLTAGGAGLTSDVAAGIEWTADQGYDVGSLSLGGGESELLRDACEYAYDQGVLLVAAAGNDGPCEGCVTYPAAYDECIAVSATNREDQLAEFSSTGPEIQLAAPGVDIQSTFLGGTYASFSGTSMAGPHVSGGGALLMADGASNEEARRKLQQSAEDIGLEKTEQGHGLLDVAAAIRETSATGRKHRSRVSAD